MGNANPVCALPLHCMGALPFAQARGPQETPGGRRVLRSGSYDDVVARRLGSTTISFEVMSSDDVSAVFSDPVPPASATLPLLRRRRS